MKGFAFVLVLLSFAALSQESFDPLRHHMDYDEHAPLEGTQKQIQVRDGIELLDISYSSPVGARAASVGPNGGLLRLT